MDSIESHILSGKSWRARAEECRAIADGFENPETRAKMLAVAAGYDRMAESAERRERQTAIEREAGALEPGTAAGAALPHGPGV